MPGDGRERRQVLALNQARLVLKNFKALSSVPWLKVSPIPGVPDSTAPTPAACWRPSGENGAQRGIRRGDNGVLRSHWSSTVKVRQTPLLR
jgi:hypothetical protein